MSTIMNTYNRFPLTISHGEDVYLYDTKGNKYLDFVAGIATNTLGYSNQTYKEALTAQLHRLMHVSNLYTTKSNEEAASKITTMSGFDQVFFVNSGTEAVEASLKLARIYAKHELGKDKFEIISMKNSFHGRTMGSLSLTGQTKYQDDFTPLLPGVRYADFNDIDSLKQLITKNTCAVIIEMIQGEGGYIVGDKDYMKQLDAFCKENKLLIIVDEVQSGIARTGTLFAYEQYDIKPDIIASAKGLGSGFPVGIILANSDVANHFTHGKHGTTYGGNPLASKAVYTTLDIIEQNNLLNHVQNISTYFMKKLHELQNNYQCITEVKGLGLMIGIDIKGIDSKEIIKKCMKKGLLLVGASKHTIRFVPPLVIQPSHVDEAIKILGEVLKEVA